MRRRWHFLTAAGVLAALLYIMRSNPSSGAHETPARRPNHLLHEKSPYLQQHAYNPVEWYPWGEEALAKARAEQKPIFLSIGIPPATGVM